MAERKRSTRLAEKNAATRRTRVSRGIRGAGRRSFRVARSAHRAAGNPGGVLAGAIALFVGAGIVVGIVKNPALITTPLQFIASVFKAFTALMTSAPGGPPHQNVAPPASAPKGFTV